MDSNRDRNYTIDIIRIMACILIVYNHTSYILSKKINPLFWSNIGVQIFFFMSGYLYSNIVINDPKSWIRKNYFKIMKPYWIYLALILPVITLLDASRLNIIKVVAYAIGIQGYKSSLFEIKSLGHLWYISYILLCYLVTPFFLRFINIMRKQNWGGVLDVFTNDDVSWSGNYNSVCIFVSI